MVGRVRSTGARGWRAGARGWGEGARAGARLAALVAIAAGLGLGGLSARLVQPAQAQALAGALASALRVASTEPGLAPWLGAALLGAGGVAAVWLCGLSLVGAPAALAGLALEGAAVAFAAGILTDAAGPGGAVLVAAAVAVPWVLLLPAWLGAAADALAFPLAGLGRPGGPWQGRLVAQYAVRGACLALAAALLACLGSALARPALGFALRLSGM